MIFEAVVCAGVVGFGATMTLVGLMARRGRLRVWRAAVEAQGATVTMASWRRRTLLRASLPPFEIDIRMWSARYRTWEPSGRFQDRNPHAMVTVEGVPDGLALTLEGEGLYRQPADKEVQIGDPGFDVRVYVQGPTALVRALLDAPLRSVLCAEFLELSGVVEAGRVRALEGRLTVPALVPFLLGWARRLQWPPDPATKLATNARQDPVAEVRLWNLMTLAREYPEDPATLPALRAGLRDTFAEVRLRAAQMLGAEGEPVLLELSQLSGRDDDDMAGRAVAALGARFGLEQAHTLLAHALRVRRPRTAKACMAVLGHAGGTEALQMLARVLAVEKGELAEAAALALGSSRRGSVEAVLVGALDHEQGFVCQAAAQALGRVGSPAAVLPLKEMEAAHPRDPDVRRAAREAVAAIQARTGGAGPGQLSIADGEPGQVSYPAAEAGRVSLPDGKARTTP